MISTAISVLLTCVTLLTPGGDGEDAVTWTQDGALAELRAIVLTRSGSASAPRPGEARTRATAWLKRVEDSGVDLGDHTFLKAVAHYLARDVDAARTVLLEHLRAKERFPRTDFDAHVGRILLTMVGRALVENDDEDLALLFPETLALASDRPLFYRRIGAALRRGEPTSRRLALLNGMLRRLLDDDELDDRGKQEVIAFIYDRGSAPKAGAKMLTPRAAARRGAGGPAPLKPFRERSLDGKEIALESYRGKVVLVDFWATWCGPCMQEAPNVVATYKKYHEQGFEIIGVSLDRAGREELLRATMAKYGITWPQIYDGQGWRAKLAVENGVRAIPATFLIGRSGKVRFTRLRGKMLGQRVKELLAEPPPSAGKSEKP